MVIRLRIESGEVAGPRIFTTGVGLVKKDGTPFYVKPLFLPELLSPEQATAIVRARLRDGADGIKVFSGSAGVPGAMPLELVKAVSAEVHRQRKCVFAHPSHVAGLMAAVDGGVDVLTHTTPDDTRPWEASLIARMKQARIALTPTLKLWNFELDRAKAGEAAKRAFLSRALEQLRAYSEAGGEILFGTDAGYMTEYDPADEYRLMAEAGMSFPQILGSLTTAPARRFRAGYRTGTVAPGMEADLVVLGDDPAVDIRALATVKYTVRQGKIIYRSDRTDRPR